MSSSSTPEDFQASNPPPSNASIAVSRIYRLTAHKRRKHQKSRTGCKTCKLRKIKCDEQRPACCNCILHGVECAFLIAKQEPRISPIPIPESRDRRGLLELELLHHFTTQTCTTLATDSSVREFWRVEAVQIGLHCDYILDAVLALSGLHLAHIKPEMRELYASKGVAYHEKASKSAIEHMKHIDGENGYNYLFLFSVLTVFFALGSPRSLDGRLFTGAAIFPEWTYLLGGSRALTETITLCTDERGTPLQPFIAYYAKRWHAIKDNTRHGRLKILDELRERVVATVHDTDLLATYNFAIEQLGFSLDVTLNDPSTPRDVLEPLLWLFKVADNLVPLLKVPTQEAVAIFAHFCLLLKPHEDQWWLVGWGIHIISQAYSVLDEEHRTWIAMPMKEIGWNPS